MCLSFKLSMLKGFLFPFCFFHFKCRPLQRQCWKSCRCMHPSVLMLVNLWQVACITTCQHSLCYSRPPFSASSFHGSDSMNEYTWSVRAFCNFLMETKTAGDGEGWRFIQEIIIRKQNQETHTSQLYSIILVDRTGDCGQPLSHSCGREAGHKHRYNLCTWGNYQKLPADIFMLTRMTLKTAFGAEFTSKQTSGWGLLLSLFTP